MGLLRFSKNDFQLNVNEGLISDVVIKFQLAKVVSIELILSKATEN